MRKYGIPYQGSKNKLAERICDLFPTARNFYDLFCGGCAVTHCALLRGQFERYVINDICAIPVKLFTGAIEGKYRNEDRWISHDDFMRLRGTDEYVACCFSFGNNYRSYCYSPKIEPYKKACHYAIVFDDWAQLQHLCPEVWQEAFTALQGLTERKKRRLAFGPAIVRRLKAIGDWDMVLNNPLYKSCHWRGGKFGIGQTNKGGQDLESLQSLECLERLQSLESLESLEYCIGDYADIRIAPKSVIYCDIPYEGTGNYFRQKFDYDRFYSWCERQTEPVFISSYAMPEDRFVEVAQFAHRSTISDKHNNAVTEKVFVPKHQSEMFRQSDLFGGFNG